MSAIGVFLLWRIPYAQGQTWQSFFDAQPIKAILLAALLILDVWIAVGQFGLKRINRFVNRLDWQRRISIRDNGVEIVWGRVSFEYDWEDLLFFRETPTLFVLKSGRASFWAIPKRAIPAGLVEQIRSTLSSRIPQK